VRAPKRSIAKPRVRELLGRLLEKSLESGHALDHEVQDPLAQWVANVRSPLRAQHNFAPGVPLFQDAIGLPDLVKREHLGDRNV
jgi:hypothetical protein